MLEEAKTAEAFDGQSYSGLSKASWNRTIGRIWVGKCWARDCRGELDQNPRCPALKWRQMAWSGPCRRFRRRLCTAVRFRTALAATRYPYAPASFQSQTGPHQTSQLANQGGAVGSRSCSAGSRTGLHSLCVPSLTAKCRIVTPNPSGRTSFRAIRSMRV